MLANKNNLKSELTANVSSSATSISITSWEWILRETDTVACLEHYENNVCTKREMVKITAKSTDTFTVTRWFADCIMNDNTKEQWHTAQTFSTGDFLTLYLSKELWESIASWEATNQSDVQTMLARITAPQTCINNCLQSWKNAIDTAYRSRCGGTAWFGSWADWDCIITTTTYLDAGREYNFNNLTICPNVAVYFEWAWVPTINVWNKFCNLWTIHLKSWFVSNTTKTDCWLSKWTVLCNQATDWWVCCGWQWWQWWSGVCGCNWCPWTATSWWAWWQWWYGWTAWCPASWFNGWNWWSGACRSSACGGGWWWGWWWGGWRFWNWWNGGDWWYTNCQTRWWTWWDGWNSGLYGKGWNGWTWWTTYGWNGWCGWNGWNGWCGWNGGNWTRDEDGWNGGCWVLRWWNGWNSPRNNGWNGGDAITNVYWFHLNARQIYNNVVNASGWQWWNGWYGGDWHWWDWWNGWNGWQMIISYETMLRQWNFSVSGWSGWCGGAWYKASVNWCPWCAWTAGWVVLCSI